VQRGGVGGGELAQVAARAERGVLAGHDDRADLVVGGRRANGVGQLRGQLDVECVAPLGVGQREDGDAVGRRGSDVGGHCRILPRTAQPRAEASLTVTR
jgi:hypothetical protein